MFNLKDHYYELDKAFEISTGLYAQVKKLSPHLRKPLYALRDCKTYIPQLTYRKINDWDRKKLVSGSRKNKQDGWRKFSTLDLVKLFIIADLRKFGMDIENIRAVLKNISTSFVESKFEGIEKTKFLQLEHFVSLAILKKPILLLVSERQNISFFEKKDVMKYHFNFDKAKDPILVLPFFLYVNKIYNVSKRKT
jgi:DNA-binding transcriptional MerR regulator